MSQSIVRPGRNAAREAKRIKEVRKVKGAIAWHEKERKKRQEFMAERYEAKQAIVRRMDWERKNVRDVRRQALRNAKEDWNLGPLRPNRAVGEGAEKYGALTSEQLQKPPIPVRAVERKNEARVKRGLEPQYPLVVDGKKYFHIVKDDRVVVVRGREKGKIGIVSVAVSETHEVNIKGINMQYFDNDMFNSSVGQQEGSKSEHEVPISINDIRLVVPYELTRNGRRIFSDVIVDKVFMERHTTGVDPYTNINHGTETIPEDHQYDPRTGLPIFDRYIAGTDHRIEWPWEQTEAVDDTGVTRVDDRGKVRKALDWAKSRMKRQESTSPIQVDEKPLSQAFEELEREQKSKTQNMEPRSDQPWVAEPYATVDTTRDIVERGDSMRYTLVAPTFPPTLREELRDEIRAFNVKEIQERKKNNLPPRIRARAQERAEIIMAKKEAAAAQLMKTPMQLRWEVEQAKKLQAQKEAPLVSRGALNVALGQYMQKQKALKQGEGSTNAQEVD